MENRVVRDGPEPLVTVSNVSIRVGETKVASKMKRSGFRTFTDGMFTSALDPMYEPVLPCCLTHLVKHV